VKLDKAYITYICKIKSEGNQEEEAIMKSSKRVLGIVASPHNSGNTATLVKEVLKGAEEKGYETDLKCLGDLKINPLIASASDK